MISEDLGFTINVIWTIITMVLIMIVTDRRYTYKQSIAYSLVIVVSQSWILLIVVPWLKGG
jgi:hypothetical protein